MAAILYPFYVGRYINSTDSVSESDKLTMQFSTVREELFKTVSVNSIDTMKELALSMARVIQQNCLNAQLICALGGLLINIKQRKVSTLGRVLIPVITLLFFKQETHAAGLLVGPSLMVVYLLTIDFVGLIEKTVTDAVARKTDNSFPVTSIMVVSLAALIYPKMALSVQTETSNDYHLMRVFDVKALPERSILLLGDDEYNQFKFLQVAYKVRPDLVGMPQAELVNVNLKKQRFRQVAFPGSHLGDFDLDKFLTYNKNKEIFISSQFDTASIKKHHGHRWGGYWYFPAQPTKALEVSKRLCERTVDYPFKHNHQFKNSDVQFYHNYFYARIGAVAAYVTPKLGMKLD